MDRHKHSRGFSITEVLVFIVVVIVVVSLGYELAHKHLAKPSSSTVTAAHISTASSSTTQYAVLTPASVPSKTVECSQAISFTSDGDSSPIQCANGDLNILAWKSLAALEPKVMSLGYNASFSQVQSALCSDVEANISNDIEETNYQISALYYGWNFNNNPAVVITNGTCQNTDD